MRAVFALVLIVGMGLAGVAVYMIGCGMAYRTGTINVNAFFASASSSSGGVKMSGIGRERGVEGIRAFQDVQVMNLGSAV